MLKNKQKKVNIMRNMKQIKKISKDRQIFAKRNFVKNTKKMATKIKVFTCQKVSENGGKKTTRRL